MAEDVSLLVAFGAGLASFLSPCVLPMVPVYLASLAGADVLEPEAKQKRLPILLHSLSFVIGFTIIFSLWGAGAGLIGSFLVAYSTVLRTVVGILLIAFGLVMLATLKVPWLNYEKRLNPSLGTTSSYLRSFIIGAVFPIAWIPCASWQLGSILSLAGSSGTVGQGTYLLAIYSLGLGIPFLLLGAAFDLVIPLLKRISRYSTWIYVISGLLLITVGILILTNRLVWF